MYMAADARRAGLTSIDDATHRESRLRSMYIGGVFLVSIPIAFIAPGLTALLWLVLFFDPAGRYARGSTR
jgi:hypothetical protein